MKLPPNFAAAESLLRERIGFGAYPNGIVARCIRMRMEAHGIEHEAAYFSLLFSNDLEQEELIEDIVVPETWFFRDYEPFEYLKRHVAGKKSEWSKEAPLRVLSVPASSGEEPYSIAITLMEAGLMPDDFRIHAVDVSRRALQKAGEALYGPSSFRGEDNGLRRKYFEEADSMLMVRPEVRGPVRFMHGNVLRENALGLQESYDVVFFRNLLIYLDEASRNLAIQNVGRVLKKGGLLVLGYAEPQQLLFPGYLPVDHPRSYASRKPFATGEEPRIRAEGTFLDGRKTPKKVMSQEGKSAIPSGCLPVIRQAGAALPQALPQPADRVALSENLPVMIARARELADAGMHDAAREVACDCLKSDAACIEAHYLLAITALACGKEEDAAGHLGRVIYLDPNHSDALFHLSLLMDRFGRKDQAARYRKRIARLEKEASPGNE
jgi:chemotaxis protein methyltransferase WspC